MNNKLYVGNISWDTTEDKLREAFAEAGTVTSVAIIMDRETNKPKGFGFVEMSSDEEAQKAISLLNDKEVDGRALRVNIARPKEDR